MNDIFPDDRDAIEIVDLDTLEQDHPSFEKIYLPSRYRWRPLFLVRRTPMRLSMLALTLLGCIFLLIALWPDIALKLPPFLVGQAPVPAPPTALSLALIPPAQQRYASVVTDNRVAYIYSYAFRSTMSGSLDALSVKTGTLMWSRKNVSAFSTPVLIKNVLYLASTDGIEALRARDGTLLWHQYMGRDIICTSNDILYTNAYVGVGVYALHVSDGSILWYNSSVTDARSPGDCSTRTKVLLATTPATAIAGQSTVALNIATGLVIWEYQSALMINFKQVNTVTTIASDNDPQASLEGKHPDGTVSWHYTTKQVWSTDEGDLYIPQPDDSVAALRPNDGSVIWQQSLINDIQAKDNGILYTSFNGSIYLRHASDGSELMIAENVGSKPIFVQNGMGFIPIPGALVAIDTRTSVQMFTWPTGIDGHILTVAGGIIYLSPILQGEPLAAIRESDGKKLWEFGIYGRNNLNAYFISTDADVTYISSPLYNTVTALHSKDGTQLWTYHLPRSA